MIIQFVCFRHDSSGTAAALERSDKCPHCRGDHRQQPQQPRPDQHMCLILGTFQDLPHHEPTRLYQWTTLGPHSQTGKVGPCLCSVLSSTWKEQLALSSSLSLGNLIVLMGLECAYDYSRMYSLWFGCEASSYLHLSNTGLAFSQTYAHLGSPDRCLVVPHWKGWLPRLSGQLCASPGAHSMQSEHLGLEHLRRRQCCLLWTISSLGLRKPSAYC